jgi:bifunctional diaminopimelate decarboxylase / aspartate kinase
LSFKFCQGKTGLSFKFCQGKTGVSRACVLDAVSTHLADFFDKTRPMPDTLDAQPAANDRWIVLKFGGTSVSSVARWQTIESLARAHRDAGRRVLIVVSALSGVTDQLKALCEAHANDAETAVIVRALRARHSELAEQLSLGVLKRLVHDFDLLDALVRDARRPSKALSWQADVLALGEYFSANMGACFLGSDSDWLDAREVLLSVTAPGDTDWAQYLSANCQVAPSAALRVELAARKPCLVTQGFVARNLAGQTVILGRGGSDTSAAYFGALLRAEAVEIWTDVPGMFSANPRKAPNARLLRKLDYDEAQEIATTGAKVLHPRCLGPVREFNVPMWVKDTTRPHLLGTQIGARDPAQSPSVKAVSVRTGLTLVSMESLGMWQQVGFLADVFTAFKRHELSVDLIGSAETNVTISLDPSSNLINADTLERLCADLAAVCRVKVIAPCAAITLVGRGIRGLMHQLSDVWAEIGAERVHLVTQSSNDLNLTFVVDEARADHLLPAVHDALLNARVLPVDDSSVLGPAWHELDVRAASVGAHAEQAQNDQAHNALLPAGAPWWRAQAAALIAIAQNGPQYVYSGAELARRLAELRAMPGVDQWFYACKANAHPALLRQIFTAGFCIECVSLQELAHVRAVLPDISPAQLLFTPNFAPRAEYASALAQGVQVTFDSSFALHHWPELVRGQAIHLRLDLGFGGGHHAKVNTGGERSKFGLSLSDVVAFKAAAAALDVRIVGLHAHLGSGIRDASHWPQVFAELATLAESFPQVTVLNLGGGLGVPSRAHEARLDLHSVGARLVELKAMYPHLAVRMEPGRYPVAECGVLLARVTQVKNKGKGTYVGLDTGMNSLIRPALYDAYHEIVNLSRLDAPMVWKNCTVVGPICETGDVLGEARALPECFEGDVMLIAECGAYGAVMSNFYNRRVAATEVML